MRLRRGHYFYLGVTLALAAFGVPACADDDDTTPRGSAPDGSVRDGGLQDSGGAVASDGGARDAGDAQAGDAGMLSNAEIVTVLTAANTAEITAGQLAVMRGDAVQVKAFARRMLTDHSAANAMLMALTRQPGGSELSRQIAADGMAQAARLKKLHGSRFDQVYIAGQIQDHTHLLLLIDSMLLPAVTDSMLQSILQSLRTTEMKHLAAARDIDDRLEADAGSEDGGT